MHDFNHSTTPHACWPGVKRIKLPPVPALAEWVHGCSSDSATRTVAVTTLVLSCCQLAGDGLTHRMPSFLLVSPEDPDGQLAVQQLATRLVTVHGRQPGECREGHLDHMTPEQVQRTMECAIIEMRGLKQSHPYFGHLRQELEAKFFAAQRRCFGTGASRPYAEAWHEHFGLITDPDDRLILRLDTENDWQAFRQDVLAQQQRLLAAGGYGAGLKFVPKHIAVSGAVTPEQWDAGFAQALMNLPLPVMLLPHAAEAPLRLPEEPLLRVLTSDLQRAFHGPLEEPANFVQHPWFEHYAAQFRQRLRHLPGNYEHAFQRMARQLYPACLHFAGFVGRATGESLQELEALALDLSAHTLRGMAIGMAGLAWHGLGFDAGCPQQEAARVLDYLRRKGPMTASDLNRKAHIDDNKLRDALVERFAQEDLVRIDGKTIRPTGFEEFVEALYARGEFPAPVNHWAGLPKAKPSAA